MKKILGVIAVILTAGLMFISANSAKAFDLDSTCTANSPWWISDARDGGVTQFFKPVLNHITKMQMTVYHQTAGTYRFSLKKADNTTLVSQEFNDTGGGVQVFQVIDGFDVEVIPGDWYKIVMERVAGNTGWYYSKDANCYLDGYAYWDGNQISGDMWFYTWGYSTSSPTTTSTTTVTSESTSTATSSSESTATTTGVSAKDIDKSITKPTLSYIEKNGQKSDAPIKDEIVVTKKDKLKIAGTSFTGVKEIKVFIGDKEFVAQVDKNGNWTVEPKLSEIKDGTYQVQAQAKNNKEKYSEKADLFKLKMENAKTSPVSVNTSQNQSFWQKLFTEYVYYTTVVLTLILAIAGISIYYFVKKKKEKK